MANYGRRVNLEEDNCCSCGRDAGEGTEFETFPGPSRHVHCQLCYSTFVGSSCGENGHRADQSLASVAWFVIDQIRLQS